MTSCCTAFRMYFSETPCS